MKVPCQGFQKKKIKATKTSNVLSLRTLIKKECFLEVAFTTRKRSLLGVF